MVFKPPPDFLNTLFVSLVGRTDKIGRLDSKLFDKILKLFRIVGDVFFDFNIIFFGFFENFIAMFISPGLKTDGIALFLLITGINIGEEII